jgi:hypothetical protein
MVVLTPGNNTPISLIVPTDVSVSNPISPISETLSTEEKVFLYWGDIPIATSASATNVLGITATVNGTVKANLRDTYVTFEYGLDTNYGFFVEAAQNPVVGDTITNVSAPITGITPGGVTYHFRVKAENSFGTVYGDDFTFLTLGAEPSATSSAATSVEGYYATLNGSINANYVPTVVTFEYGLTTGYGSTATANQSPVIGNTSTSVSTSLSGLTGGGITYHFRVKAVNVLGTTYGEDLTFITLGNAPAARTFAATNILSTTATLNGTARSGWLDTIVTFDYGITASYGSTVTADVTPLSGSPNVTVDIKGYLSGLTPSTLYHYRAKSVNSKSTIYGSKLTFTTAAS